MLLEAILAVNWFMPMRLKRIRKLRRPVHSVFQRGVMGINKVEI